jgi:hypothetical protein
MVTPSFGLWFTKPGCFYRYPAQALRVRAYGINACTKRPQAAILNLAGEEGTNHEIHKRHEILL